MCCTAQKGTCQRVTMGFTLLVGLCKSFCKRFPLRILTWNLGWQNLTRWQWTGPRALLAERGQFSNKTSGHFLLKRPKNHKRWVYDWFDHPPSLRIFSRAFKYPFWSYNRWFNQETWGFVTLYNRSPFSNQAFEDDRWKDEPPAGTQWQVGTEIHWISLDLWRPSFGIKCWKFMKVPHSVHPFLHPWNDWGASIWRVTGLGTASKKTLGTSFSGRLPLQIAEPKP